MSSKIDWLNGFGTYKIESIATNILAKCIFIINIIIIYSMNNQIVNDNLIWIIVHQMSEYQMIMCIWIHSLVIRFRFQRGWLPLVDFIVNIHSILFDTWHNIISPARACMFICLSDIVDMWLIICECQCLCTIPPCDQQMVNDAFEMANNYFLNSVKKRRKNYTSFTGRTSAILMCIILSSFFFFI